MLLVLFNFDMVFVAVLLSSAGGDKVNDNFMEVLKEKSKIIRVRSKCSLKSFRLIGLDKFKQEYKKYILKTKKGSRYIKLGRIDGTLIETSSPYNIKAFEKSIEERKGTNGIPF